MEKGERELLGEEYLKISFKRKKKMKWQKRSKSEDIPYLPLMFEGNLEVRGCSATQRSTWAEEFTESDPRG